MKKFVLPGLAILLLAVSALVFAGKDRTEKIAVATNGQTPSVLVSSQAGRSPFFLFFDKKGTFLEVVSNPYKDSGKSGISVVDFLANKGVTVIVAEGFGPTIIEVMKSKGMRPVEFKGSAADAVKKILQSN